MRNAMNRSSLIKEQTKGDIFFTVLMSMIWADSILMRYIRVGIQMIPHIWKHADMIISLMYLIMFFLSLGEMLRSVYMKEILYLIMMYVVFLLYFYLVPANKGYFYNSGITISKVFPMFMIGICAYRISRDQIVKALYGISIITVLLFAFYRMMNIASDQKLMMSGDMHGAYSLLPHICLVFAGFIKKPRPLNGCTFSVGVLILLFLGNRGSLLCLGVFIVVTILFSGRLKRPWLFLILSAIVMMILFFFGLLDLLYNVAEEHGFSLRIFKKLESGEIADSSGRNRIHQRVWEYILRYPMLGMGIFSDRQVAGGYYAHNIVLEVLIHYGIGIGSALLGLVAYLLVFSYKYLRQEKRPELDLFGALVFSYGFKLLMSSSYLLEPYFFFTLGFACAIINERNQALRIERRSRDRKGLVRFRRIKV